MSGIEIVLEYLPFSIREIIYNQKDLEEIRLRSNKNRTRNSNN